MNAERYNRIDRIAQAAGELPANEIAAYLDSACGGDPDLRREVESLILYQQKAHSFLEEPALKRAAALLAGSVDESIEGLTIANYKIERRIGAGGMGEVYLAQDTRLDRKVAIKFLPHDVAADELARKRLIREARAAAKLDHPNICAVHEVNQQDSLTFIVMQYVEGETLSTRIERSPLETPEVLAIAVQVADALSEAHSRGIVHRDIKPANIMLTASGSVRVLDFGLAKVSDQRQSAQSQLKTESLLSEPGMIAGTVPYMSPEQVSGKAIDGRSDIFSVGAVLYEMISGHQPFQAESEAESISAILTREPPSLAEYSTEIPRELERIVSKTLRKDPEHRYQSAKDLLIDLNDLKHRLEFEAELERSKPPETERTILSAAQAHPRPISSAGFLISETKAHKKGALAGLLIAGLLVAAAVWYLVLRPAAPNSTALKTTFTQLTDSAGPELFPSLAPDGKSFIFGSRSSGNWDIYLQRVGGKNPSNLTKDSSFDDVQPAFSPDGEHIAFRSEREGGGIFLMGATGESVRRLTNFGFHPAWSPDGKEILCSMESIADPTDRFGPTGLRVVNVTTGENRELASGDAVQGTWSPQGQRIAYWGLQKGGQRDIWTMPAAGGEPVQVTNDPFIDWNPVWAPDGRYLYFSSNRGGSMNLWRVGIDEQTGKVHGQPEAVTTPSQYSQHISFSRDGHRVAYVQTLTRVNIQRVGFDPAGEKTLGEREWITQGSRRSTQPNLSTDGEWLVYSSQGEPQEDLFISSKDGNGLRQLTDDVYKDRHPRWSPDGKRIAAYSDRGGRYAIWLINPDGSGLHQLTSTSALGGIYPVWSPDGNRVADTIRLDNVTAISDANKSSNEQSPELLPRVDDPGMWFEAWSWSPDGRRLIGTLRRQGGADIGIIAYSFESRSYEKLTDAGSFPIWLSDNRRALFLDQEKIHIVDSQTKKVHEILSVAPYAVGFLSISRDDRLIYYSIVQTEADVWMMTLE